MYHLKNPADSIKAIYTLLGQLQKPSNLHGYKWAEKN